jgi:Fanconi anemia group D2 protein
MLLAFQVVKPCGLVLGIDLEKHTVFIVRAISCLLYKFNFCQNSLFLFSQIEKMARLINYVPLVRKTLEALIFRVKGMLVANNSPDAFWMGNLKNKTIRGEEILTQVGIL